MHQVVIPGTELKVSRFIFGTGSLFNAGSRKARLNVLAAAREHGFTHFDTAPYYGFGWAERDLAPLLAAHPQLTVTSKVGIFSAGGENQPELMVLARKAMGHLIRPISKPQVDWNVARARRSLDASLKRLGRTRIDLYTLHDPDLSLVDTEEWQRWLERESVSGRIGNYGISVDAPRLAPFLTTRSGLAKVIQTTDSLQRQEADQITQHGRPLQVTYGYVSAARAAGPVDVPSVLAAALNRNPDGAVIVSSLNLKHLPQYARIASECSQRHLASCP